MHIDYTDQSQSAKSDVSKCQSDIQSAKNDDSKCQSVTLEELAVLREIVKKPVVTQKELAVGTYDQKTNGCFAGERRTEKGKWQAEVS